MRDYYKLAEKLARLQNIIMTILVIAVVALVGALIMINQKPAVIKKKLSRPTIALVNEDFPVLFNQVNYNLGKSFVDSVSNDKRYNWQVVSRSVADRAYKENAVDAIIYLPQSFSRDLLSLQEISPTQTKVDYKVQHQSDELLDTVLGNKVASVLYAFNQDIVKMYYASIAGNVAEAENSMDSVIGKNTKLVTNLIGQVKMPFTDSIPNYNLLISGADSLKNVNKATISTLNNFTDMTTKRLLQTSDSFTKQGAYVNDYFDLQRQIGNQNVLNANKGIESQAKENQAFYFSQFTSQNTNFVDRVALLSPQKRDGKSDEPFEAYKASFNQLENKVKTYNKTTEETQQDVSTQIGKLVSKRDALLTVEKALYAQFFSADLSITKDNYDNYKEQAKKSMTSYFARKALANKIKTSFVKSANLPLTEDKKAVKSIQKLISQISVNASDYKLETLLANGSISPETKTSYENALNVIQNYATAYQLTPGQVVLAEMPGEDDVVKHTMTQKITVKVPPQTIYTSNALSSSISDVTIEETGRTPVGPVDPVDPVDPADPADPEKSKKENGKSKSRYTRQVKGDRELVLDNRSDDSVDYTITLIVTLDGENTKSFDVTWKNSQNDAPIYSAMLTFIFGPRGKLTNYAKYVGLEQFDKLTNLFNKIDLTANLIGTFYADPEKPYTDLSDVKSKEEFENFTDDSIFNIYGNITVAGIPDKLSKKDVAAFRKQGKQKIKQVIALIKQIDSVVESLEKDQLSLAVKLPEDYFPTTLQSLQDWYDQMTHLIDTNYQQYEFWHTDTLSSIDNIYSSWEVKEASLLELKNVDGPNFDGSALYVNNTNELNDQLNALITSSNEASQSIVENAQSVQDNSSEFERLLVSANTTQADAQKVLHNTTYLVDTGLYDLDAIKNYYTNFSKVLANTRTVGVDTTAIYDFFVKPIVAKNMTPEKKAQNDSQKRDYRSTLVFLTGLFGGMLLLMGWQKLAMLRMKREVDL